MDKQQLVDIPTPCACYGCGKPIKGQAVRTVPPNISIMLGIDFPKSWHPACYEKAEKIAAAELRGAA